MRRPLFLIFLFSSLVVAMPLNAYGQAAAKTSTGAAGTEAQRALSLAESGHCTQALPLLKKAIRQVTDKDLRKRVGLDGVHCAMTHDVPHESLAFVEVLVREFPRDPEVLYVVTHAFSDLSLLSSQDLMRE